ncbi:MULTISPECIES: glycine cleavage system aminomethyltransferase GcvT [unclassified Paenibacillus]|uniref:glycine cleavage system aminomethyltransferase GcvT n=1 Tax=unclassified Paenibacillus TaxID=185978 RepID=UPI001AE9FEEE|nr:MULTISPECIES: glycine cleavage system aminomethyltransferase GcvT [unclassified Paenibacillus]MBP1156733.1 aminomethyltransferase [Paenibacillus sp. PvP091]MBP2438909.1 aminomethyltransferase [Paenibacillus sp. PvP052]
MSPLKRTPLFPLYADEPGVRCIDFGGWELPVQFTGIQKEHDAVRQYAGLFDVSHMGEVIVIGTYAEAYLQVLTTNNVAKLKDGQAQYSLMCCPDGGVVDDLLVYRLSADQFMLVVNASNIDKDLEWMDRHLIGDVVIQNISEQTALLALQGPLAETILSQVTDAPLAELTSFSFIPNVQVCGVQALISRTGYTGEDGFELYLPSASASVVWKALLENGREYGLIPAGLGARDTLRFEARLPLYGQELSEAVSPLEAGLSFCVKLDKERFIGKETLLKQKQEGLRRRLVGIEMIDRGIPRTPYKVYADGQCIGEVTSGTQSPTLKRSLGLAFLDSRYANIGTKIEVEIRGKQLRAQVVPSPFYKRTQK